MTSAAIEATTPPPANAPQGGSLLHICNTGTQLEERAFRAWDDGDDLMPRGTQEVSRLYDEASRLHGQAEALAGVAADMAASDMAGLLGKARLVAVLSTCADDERERLAVSLARDLLTLHGA